MSAAKLHPLEEKTLDSTEILRGNFLHVYRDQIALPDGKHSEREYIRHPGAVMIVPLLDDGQVVMERQFRYPLHRVFTEFPAGKVDAGESLIACGKRELIEETGYHAARWSSLGTIHNAIAYSDEKIELFLAEGLNAVGQRLDEGEHLEVFTVPWRSVLADVLSGEITDVKTIVGIFRLEKILSGSWPRVPAAS